MCLYCSLTIAEYQIKAIPSYHLFSGIYFTSDELIFRPRQGVPYQWDVLDSRYGYLGNTILGRWGRTVTVDKNGLVYDDFNKFRIPMDMNFSDVMALWRAAFTPSQESPYLLR